MILRYIHIYSLPVVPECHSKVKGVGIKHLNIDADPSCQTFVFKPAIVGNLHGHPSLLAFAFGCESKSYT